MKYRASNIHAQMNILVSIFKGYTPAGEQLNPGMLEKLMQKFKYMQKQSNENKEPMYASTSFKRYKLMTNLV